ncbi:hypothetical protein I0Q12_28895, partial [Rhodococcus sp. CX]|nr:hypothetical protein [Rhodococcus sp. CX]
MSATRKGGLGRGLAALIPTGPVEAPPVPATAPAGTGTATAPTVPAPSAPAPAGNAPSKNNTTGKTAAARKASGVSGMTIPSSGLGSAAADVIIGDGTTP